MISAPSGTGKTSVIRRVKNLVKGLGYSVSHTTRPPRPGEKDGVDYHFVSQEEFNKMIQDGAFVEWARVYEGFYGTSYQSIESVTKGGNDVILDLDPQGAKNIKARYGSESVLIYLLPPDMESLEQRLKGRGTDSEEVIRKRLNSAVQQIKECLTYDYIVFNDGLDVAVEEVCSIVRAERCKAPRVVPHVKERFKIP